MIHGRVSEMAEEYYLQGEYTKAQKLFESITPSYRKEGWSVILNATLERILHCSVRLIDGRHFAQTALELLAIPQGRTDPDAWQKAAQMQAELWAVLGIPPCLDLETAVPVINPDTATALRNAGLCDQAPPFDVTNHKLLDCIVSFDVAEVFALLEFRFFFDITVRAPGTIQFQALSASCSNEQFSVELIDDGTPSLPENMALRRPEQLSFAPGVARRFSFSATADQACEIRFMDVVLSLSNAVSLRWDATTAVESSLGSEYGWARKGPTVCSALKVLAPEAKATIVVEQSPPALVDEYFPLTVVTSANEDNIGQGSLSLKLIPGSAKPLLLDGQLAPLGETVRQHSVRLVHS